MFWWDGCYLYIPACRTHDGAEALDALLQTDAKTSAVDAYMIYTRMNLSAAYVYIHTCINTSITK